MLLASLDTKMKYYAFKLSFATSTNLCSANIYGVKRKWEVQSYWNVLTKPSFLYLDQTFSVFFEHLTVARS